MIKLINILEEIQSNKILIPRRSEERSKKYIDIINKKIQQYINDGSKGDLNLSHTKITSLPDDLKVVGGSLYLGYTPITSLPSGLKVGGNLNLDSTPITSLPDGLTVEGYLNLNDTKITSLPSGLKVNGSVYLIDTPLSKKYTKKQLKQMYPGIEGNIFL